MEISWSKRRKEFKSRDWPFYCFGTPIWPTWRHGKTLYIINSQSDQLPVSLLAQLVERCSGITEVIGSNHGRSSLRIRGICLIWRPEFGILSQYVVEIRDRKYAGMRDAENNHRDYGIDRKFGSEWQDWGTRSGILLSLLKGFKVTQK